MAARTIISAVTGGAKIAIRSWLALRMGKRQAKEGVKVFKRTLQKMGLPKKVTEDFTETYQSTAEFLSIWRLAQLAIQGIRARGHQ